jgi:hypothetical protein
MTSSKTYIVAWDEAVDNCVNISNQLSSADLSYTVFNVSQTTNQTASWQTANDVRYYGHFFNAIKDFLSTEHSIFIFNAGDIEYDRYGSYTKHIEKLFADNSNLAVFSPNSTNDIYSGPRSLIEQSSKYPELYLSTNTDGTYTSMTREMAGYMNDFYDWSKRTDAIDFSTMRSGWGLDHVYCSLAIYLNKIVYRDSATIVYHPVGKTYDMDVAIQEFYKTMKAFLQFAEEVLNADSERLRDIVNKTLGKVKRFDDNPLGKEAVYTDLEAVQDA